MPILRSEAVLRRPLLLQHQQRHSDLARNKQDQVHLPIKLVWDLVARGIQQQHHSALLHNSNRNKKLKTNPLKRNLHLDLEQQVLDSEHNPMNRNLDLLDSDSNNLNNNNKLLPNLLNRDLLLVGLDKRLNLLDRNLL